jgi:hypothetical protein
MEHPTNGDQLKEGHAVIETYVFDRMYMFFPTVVASVSGHLVEFNCIISSKAQKN